MYPSTVARDYVFLMNEGRVVDAELLKRKATQQLAKECGVSYNAALLSVDVAVSPACREWARANA